ncbi:MAG: hypothetical protein WHT65_03715 [Pseudothermotoga sp.]
MVLSAEIFFDLQQVSGDSILLIALERLVKDISLLCLGCNQNLETARDVGFAAGMVARSYGFHYVVFGTLDTLDDSDSDPLGRISRSAFITSQVITYLAEGLFNSGVVPILNGLGDVDADVIRSLINRKAIYPVLVENESKIKRLQELGYENVFVFVDGRVTGKLPRNNVDLKVDLSVVQDIRKRALEGAVVILGKTERAIHVNQPFKKSGVLVFSDEEWLLKIAQEVLEGRRSSTGRIP